QRKRLPANADGPLFVVALDAETNTVVVGRDADLYAPGLIADNCTWSAVPDLETAGYPLAVYAKIRYNGVASPARIATGEMPGTVEARFETPQRAVTPGQAAVFYGGAGAEAGQVVVGGSTILTALS